VTGSGGSGDSAGPGARPSTSSIDVLAGVTLPVPDAISRRVEAWVPGTPAVEPLPSASVLLLRDGGGGLQTYLLHRHARMPFAASMVVFPGGRVDPVDAEDGRDPVRACAVRETMEETGVVLGTEDLYDWAHWTTPEVEPLRYDTRFFVAALPDGQEARDLSGETDRAAWTAPAAALAAAERGEIALMPPTRTMLAELADAGTLGEVLRRARHRTVVPVLPRLRRTAGGWEFHYEDDADA